MPQKFIDLNEILNHYFKSEIQLKKSVRSQGTESLNMTESLSDYVNPVSYQRFLSHTVVWNQCRVWLGQWHDMVEIFTEHTFLVSPDYFITHGT